MAETGRSTDGEDVAVPQNGFDMRLPFNMGRVSGRGWVAIVAMTVLGFFGSAGGLVYINYKGFEDVKVLLRSNTYEHREIALSQDRQTCIISLTMEERVKFRQGGSQWDAWCPWLRYLSSAPH